MRTFLLAVALVALFAIVAVLFTAPLAISMPDIAGALSLTP